MGGGEEVVIGRITNAVIDIELVYDAVDVFFNRFLFGFKLQALFLNGVKLPM